MSAHPDPAWNEVDGQEFESLIKRQKTHERIPFKARKTSSCLK